MAVFDVSVNVSSRSFSGHKLKKVQLLQPKPQNGLTVSARSSGTPEKQRHVSNLADMSCMQYNSSEAEQSNSVSQKLPLAYRLPIATPAAVGLPAHSPCTNSTLGTPLSQKVLLFGERHS